MADWGSRFLSFLGQRGARPASPSGNAAAPRARSLDSLVSQLQEAFALDDGQAAKLSLIRRGAIYACVTLRADMLAGLPLRLYRLDGTGRGRSVTVREPWQRYGMPASVRGQRLADAGEVEEVDAHPVLSRLSRPNADWTGRSLIRMTETGLGVVGQAHWRLHRGPSGTGQPEAISWIRDGRMEVRKPQTAEERAAFRTVAGWTMDGAIGGGGTPLTPGEVVWFRYPDPEDPDYGALAPAAVARLGADSYTSALRANRDIFRRGLRADAIATPGEEFAGQWSSENVGELQEMIDRVLSGEGRNHAVQALPYPMAFQRLDISPKDAEFMALLEVCVEDVARAYRIPIEMVGGTRRTYTSVEAADRALWQRSLEPEASWFAEEVSVKVLPAFGLDPDTHFLAFDLSDVTALQDDETSRWVRAKEQIALGGITVNEWRAEEGLEPVAWGDAWWAGSGLVPVEGIAPKPEPEAVAGEDDDTDNGGGAATLDASALPSRLAPAVVGPQTREARGPEFGSVEHRAVMERRDKAMAPHERAIEREMRGILEAQQASVLDKLRDARVAGGVHARVGLADLPALFSRARWIRDSRIRMLPRLLDAAREGGRDVAKELGEKAGENAAANAMRRQAQRFAVAVTDTTWDRLRGSLAAGIEEGESIDALAKRVGEVFSTRSRSDARTIARTESHTAYHRGGLETVKSFDGDFEKTWLSALDSRVRPDHRDAHGQTVAMDEQFEVGGARGDAPGDMGEAAQDILCRCSVMYSRTRRSAHLPLGVEHGVSATS